MTETILFLALVALIIALLRKKKHQRNPRFIPRPISRRFSRNPKNKKR